jgi:two-component system sensor histidine kinase KdpD
MDFVLIAQVLTNLLENALAYSPVGTPIGVRVSRDSTHLRVQVLDRGFGLGSIDPELLFERFERGTADGTTGVGLGLSICRGLVEAHQGQIFGAAREGGGAVFTFTLPLEVSNAH